MGNISLEITAKFGGGEAKTFLDTVIFPSYSAYFPPITKALVLNSYVVVQSANYVWLFTTPWTATLPASMSSWNLPKFMSIASVVPSSHFIPCHSLLLLPSVFPSIRVFSNELALCIRWPKYWSFNISPPNENSVLISFKIDWFDLLAVQGNLKSLLQHFISKASILHAQPSLWSSSDNPTWLMENYCSDYTGGSLEGLMLKLKLQCFGHLMRRADSLEKTLMPGKIEGRRRSGWQRMRWLDGITGLWTWVWVDTGSWW